MHVSAQNTLSGSNGYEQFINFYYKYPRIYIGGKYSLSFFSVKLLLEAKKIIVCLSNSQNLA